MPRSPDDATARDHDGEGCEIALVGARIGRKRKWLFGGVVFVLAFPLVLLLGLRSGPAGSVVKEEALTALAAVLPADTTAEIADAHIVLDGLDGIAVSLRNLAIRRSGADAPLVTLDTAVIGIHTMSILAGQPKVEYLTFMNGVISIPETANTNAAWPRIAQLNQFLDDAMSLSGNAIDRTKAAGIPQGIELSNIVMNRATERDGSILAVRHARLWGRGQERQLQGEVEVLGNLSSITGALSKDAAGSVTLQLDATDFPLPIGRLHTMFSANEDDHLPGAANPPVLADVAILASENGAAPPSVTMAVKPKDLTLKLEDGDYVAVEGNFAFAWDAPAAVLRLQNSAVRLGRSAAVLTGAMRDPPGTAAEQPARYEFQLVANRGRADPRDSPSNAIRFAGRAEGEWVPKAAAVEFKHIELDSSAGYAEGTGRLDFSTSVPTALFASSVSDFTVAGLKQFWPATVARAARRWVLDNLAGGRVTEGEFLIAEPLRRRVEGTETRLTGSSEVSLAVDGVRFDVAGDIPPVRDATGRVEFKDGTAVITLEDGTAFMPSGRTAAASGGMLVIYPADESGLVFADLALDVSGDADAIGEIISYKPIDARSYRDYRPEELSGYVEANVAMKFVLNPMDNSPPPAWDVHLQLQDASVETPFEGRQLAEMSGSVKINPRRAEFDVSGLVDGIPADIDMIMPFVDDIDARRDIVLNLSDPDRKRIAPGLETILSGTTPVHVVAADEQETLSIMADLTPAELALPWLGWSKGVGIGATTIFDLVIGEAETRLDNFNLDGASFSADGSITVTEAGLQNARFGTVRLNETDDIAVTIERNGKGYDITVTGKAFDARSLVRHLRETLSAKDTGGDELPVDISARIDRVSGFGDEVLKNLKLDIRHNGKDLVALSLEAATTSGFPVVFELKGAGNDRVIEAETLDVGELLRFLDIYGQVRGGVGRLSLAGHGSETMTGNIRIQEFRVFDEPRLKSLVSNRSADDTQSLNEAIRREIDTSEVVFDLASANLAISPASFAVQKGVVRGPLVGSTFQGMISDASDQMRITGTFLPAYGLNSLFADIPIFGLILGNGRDRGLIGVTFMLEGDPQKPKVSVNPLSVIAPGVFRSIFEFR